MKSKTEDLLYLLLWGCDMLSRPTFRNLTDSFESWAYRNGFQRQLRDLERRDYLEAQTSRMAGSKIKSHMLRLTESAKLHALGGRDPEERWNRRWDKKWRMVVFDFPNALTKERNQLRRYLKHRGFGYLQNSVWITPDPLSQGAKELTDLNIDVESLILLDATPGGCETHEQIVNGAWNFKMINDAYRSYMAVLNEFPLDAHSTSVQQAIGLRDWSSEERRAWIAAVSEDPLLPNSLCPSGYLGRMAWKDKLRVMRGAAKIIRSFQP